ncbi:hypothetical protein OIS_03876, partial [Enterococcus faecium EnGen0035]
KLDQENKQLNLLKNSIQLTNQPVR